MKNCPTLQPIGNQDCDNPSDNSFEPEEKVESIYGYYEINANEINSLISQTYLYEDVEMTYTTFPMPFISTQHDLLKRQNDIFSGNMPFNQTVSFSRNFFI